MWRNWAGDQHCTPAAFVAPATTAEIVAAIGHAAAERRRVRVAGAGHSFGDLVPTNGHLMSLRRMAAVLDADRASGLVRVQAGITIHALNRRLSELGLALENVGDIEVQSIAGAIATATHGTGGRLRNISSQVSAAQLVAADGEVTEVDGSDADLLRAVRVNLGALGVVSELTLRCVPAFTLEGVDAPAPLEEALDRLDELVDSNDHFELFTFPHSDLALTRTNNRTDAPPAPPSAARSWVDDILLGNHLFGLACAAGRVAPRAIPTINRAVSHAVGTRRRVDRSHAIFASPRRVRFTEMEYAVPRAHAAAAVRAVRAAIGERGFAVSFPIEVRFVAPDDALLSPAAGRETCYIAVHMYRGMAWQPYFRCVEEIMDGFGGRPHWGKRHFQTAETLRERYPDWDRFAAIRARLDPEGRFANPYVDRVLGRPATAPSPR